MHEQIKALLDLLAKDAAEWEKAAEDMDYISPLLPDESHRRSSLTRASCYRENARRDRAAVSRTRQQWISEERLSSLP